MLAVILLIGIAAAAVSVSVSQGLKGARVSAASGELAAAMRATRAQAIVKGQTQSFDVDIRSGSYRGAGGRQVELPSGKKRMRPTPGPTWSSLALVMLTARPAGSCTARPFAPR